MLLNEKSLQVREGVRLTQAMVDRALANVDPVDAVGRSDALAALEQRLPAAGKASAGMRC
ncbi:hypothetical protein [Amycolatopsis sp. Hca4]|uniref:hypothetical protein n=1 Tax=Amycolatopsis sp. Hca4 TaxID=2742131 RepID=UPI001591AABB|nr:hypothetical protein [Amycolatopsis sp. Hca4]QKV76468.1 hypothetical protein HUT10_23815 [Amycolatopsis sp. Hca4]